MDLDVHVELAAEKLFTIGPIEVTNSMATMWVIMALIILVFWAAARKGALIPGRFQSAIEMIVDFVSNLVYGTAGRKFGGKILPIIFGLFVFIWIANLSGLLPGVGTIGYYEEEAHAEVVLDGDHDDEAQSSTVAATDDHAEEEAHKVLVPFIRPPNADLNMTLAMALLAVGAVQVYGIRAHGFGGRIKHMADPPFLFPIEVIGEVSRVVSLSARLFGNVFAGEVLLGVMFALGAALKIAVLPLVFPVVFLGLELLFGTIQALVFSLLTLIYLTLAAAHHGPEHEEGHGHEAAHHPATSPAVGD
ncbi:MAG: F0F1 ATP synthase subunit A [Thermomicrobiales bacterium]|nr:F0F1 ATP synthase subunit A [Thermomicrobiales bacterium]